MISQWSTITERVVWPGSLAITTAPRASVPSTAQRVSRTLLPMIRTPLSPPCQASPLRMMPLPDTRQRPESLAPSWLSARIDQALAGGEAAGDLHDRPLVSAVLEDDVVAGFCLGQRLLELAPIAHRQHLAGPRQRLRQLLERGQGGQSGGQRRPAHGRGQQPEQDHKRRRAKGQTA